MVPYITFREPVGEELRYYILQKKWPQLLAVITYLPLEDALVQSVPVAGHSLYVSFAGRIDGNFLPAQKGIVEEAQSVLNEMADWYYQNRILPNGKRYKKFKITPNETVNLS